jgi:hypothetical protein
MGRKEHKAARKAETAADECGRGDKLEIDYEGIYAQQKKLETLCLAAQTSKSIE